MTGMKRAPERFTPISLVALTFVLAFLNAARSLLADTISLKDGTTVTGEIIEQTRTTVTTRTATGILILQKARIQRISYGRTLPEQRAEDERQERLRRDAEVRRLRVDEAKRDEESRIADEQRKEEEAKNEKREQTTTRQEAKHPDLGISPRLSAGLARFATGFKTASDYGSLANSITEFAGLDNGLLLNPADRQIPVLAPWHFGRAKEISEGLRLDYRRFILDLQSQKYETSASLPSLIFARSTNPAFVPDSTIGRTDLHALHYRHDCLQIGYSILNDSLIGVNALAGVRHLESRSHREENGLNLTPSQDVASLDGNFAANSRTNGKGPQASFEFLYHPVALMIFFQLELSAYRMEVTSKSVDNRFYLGVGNPFVTLNRADFEFRFGYHGFAEAFTIRFPGSHEIEVFMELSDLQTKGEIQRPELNALAAIRVNSITGATVTGSPDVNAYFYRTYSALPLENGTRSTEMVRSVQIGIRRRFSFGGQ